MCGHGPDSPRSWPGVCRFWILVLKNTPEMTVVNVRDGDPPARGETLLSRTGVRFDQRGLTCSPVPQSSISALDSNTLDFHSAFELGEGPCDQKVTRKPEEPSCATTPGQMERSLQRNCSASELPRTAEEEASPAAGREGTSRLDEAAGATFQMTARGLGTGAGNVGRRRRPGQRRCLSLGHESGNLGGDGRRVRVLPVLAWAAAPALSGGRHCRPPPAVHRISPPPDPARGQAVIST